MCRKRTGFLSPYCLIKRASGTGDGGWVCINYKKVVAVGIGDYLAGDIKPSVSARVTLSLPPPCTPKAKREDAQHACPPAGSLLESLDPCPANLRARVRNAKNTKTCRTSPLALPVT